LICGYCNSYGADPEVGTLIDSDEGKSPLTMRGLGDTMSHEL